MVVDVMIINEILWFCDIYLFEVFKQWVFFELIKVNGGQCLWIWLVVCLLGQELYLLLMVIDEFEKINLGQLKVGVQIVVIDLLGLMFIVVKVGEYDILVMGCGLFLECL